MESPLDSLNTKAQLLAEIEALHVRLREQHGTMPGEAVLSTVRVPAPFREPFLKAQEYVARYFADRVEDPTRSTISISGERYILVRAASMSVEFFDMVTSLYKDQGPKEARAVTNNLLFDLAHAIGKADAKSFHARMGVTDPISRLSAGPIHFAFSGWAFVEIHPESSPTPDEGYYLIYDHPFSFESDAWLKSGRRSERPVCIMNCGYSSGWCEESFGLPLVAAEVRCVACGDAHCRFIMAPPSRIEEHIARFHERARGGAGGTGGGGAPRGTRRAGAIVPEFFQRKRLEEALREANAGLEERVARRTEDLERANRALQTEVAERVRAERQQASLQRERDELLERLQLQLNLMPIGCILNDAQMRFTYRNRAAQHIFGYRFEEVVGRHPSELIIPASAQDDVAAIFRRVARGETVAPVIGENRTRDGRIIICEWHNTPLHRPDGEIIGVMSMVQDITERQQGEQRQTLLMRELDHRVKNTLASVLSILDNTVTDAPSLASFRDSFRGRILALARTHEALAHGRWSNVDLAEMIRSTLEPFSRDGGPAFTLSGPVAALPSEAAIAVCMSLHELATNAAKYGALSVPQGRIEIVTRYDADDAGRPALELTWSEDAGPAVSPPTRQGFGITLIHGMISHELGGRVEFEFPARGLVCRMVLPLTGREGL